MGSKTRLPNAGGRRVAFDDEDADVGGFPDPVSNLPDAAAATGAGAGDVVSAPAASIKTRGKFSSEVPESRLGLERLQHTIEAFNDTREANERTLSDSRRREAVRLRDKFLQEAADGKFGGGLAKGHRVMMAAFSEASNTGYDTTPSMVGAQHYGSNKTMQIRMMLNKPVLAGLEDVLMEGMERQDMELTLKMLQYVAKHLGAAMRPHQEAAIDKEHAAELAAYVDQLLCNAESDTPCPVCLFFDVIGGLMLSHVSATNLPALPGSVPSRPLPGGDADADEPAPSAKRRRGAKEDVSRVYLGAARWTAGVPSRSEATQALVDLTDKFMTQMSGLTPVSDASAAHLFNTALLSAMLQEQTGVWAMLQQRHPKGRAGLSICGADVRRHLVDHMQWPRAQLTEMIIAVKRDLLAYQAFGSKLVDTNTSEETMDTRVTAAVHRCRAQLFQLYKELKDTETDIKLQDCLTVKLPKAATEVVEPAAGGGDALMGKRRRGKR